MVWMTPEERLRDFKARTSKMLDLSMNSIRWERQTGLMEIFKVVGYAEGEKRLIWQLPGHGRAYDDCGQVRLKGCDHVESHQTR